MNNEIYFRRSLKICPPDYLRHGDARQLNFAGVASLDANLRKLGFTLHADLAVALMGVNPDTLKVIHDEAIRTAKELKGVRRYRAMYPNFPKQVMEASDAELYINAMLHYWGDAFQVRIMPNYPTEQRAELDFDESKYKVIKLGAPHDYIALMANLMSSKSAFSTQDRNDIASMGVHDFMAAIHQVESFDNRENKAVLAALLLGHGQILQDYIKFDTATDVLRLAVAMSDGDVSLAEPTKFRNFRRYERRLLIGLLDDIYKPEEDMLRHESAWKRLGEKLHPGEFKSNRTAVEAFNTIRNNGTVEVFNAQVEKALAEKDVFTAIDLLVTRPGEFARRLDHVLRIAAGYKHLQAIIVDRFGEVAGKVSPTVLLQLRNAMLHREGKRAFFPKGSVAKLQVMEDTRTELSENVRNAVVLTCGVALQNIFNERGYMGKVFLDESLQKVAIPFGMRNAAEGTKTLGRGSRLPLGGDTKTLRFFIWWKDTENDASKSNYGYSSRVDIDLSAVVLDADMHPVLSVSYTNLRETGVVHSGDITSAPKGASEFIDIDFALLKRYHPKARYVAMTLHNYSGQAYAELPECFAGFMERPNGHTGEIYDPRTVTNKVDLTAKSTGATPFIFDLMSREAIWVDLSIRAEGGYHNVHSTKTQITDIMDTMVNLTPPSLHDLFWLHATGRGCEWVYDRSEVDEDTTVFALDGTVTPFDTEKILSEYL